MPDLCYRLKSSGHFSWISASAAMVFGWSADSLPNQRFNEVFLPTKTGWEWELMAADLQHGILTIEHTLRLASGEVHVETRLALAADGRGGRSIVGLTRQAARPETERASWQSEERLRLTLNAAGVVAWELDPQGRLIETGPVDRVFGLPEGRGHTTAEEFVRDVHPEDREWVRGRAEEVWQMGGDYHVEYRALQADGSVRWLEAHGTAIRDSAGKAIRLLGIARDITERKRTLEALRESEQMFRIAFDNAPTGMSIIGPKGGNYLAVNPLLCQMFGYTKEEFLDNSITLVTHPDDVARSREWVRKKINNEPCEADFEKRYLHKDGHVVWGQVRAQWIRNGDGSPRMAISHILDITDRKQAETILRASLAEKEALLKEVHHRVKNNLQIVTSLLNLQSARETQESVRTALRDMQSRVRSMALLHEALYRSTNLAQIDFGAYVRNLCDQLARGYQRAGQAVRFDIQTANVHLDLERAVPCGLIINELVTNAFKHAFRTDQAAEIVITSHEPAPGQIEITVADNGVGMAPDFDLSRSQSLGLQLIARLTDQLGGSLRLESRVPVEFRIRFPV